MERWVQEISPIELYVYWESTRFYGQLLNLKRSAWVSVDTIEYQHPKANTTRKEVNDTPPFDIFFTVLKMNYGIV